MAMAPQVCQMINETTSRKQTIKGATNLSIRYLEFVKFMTENKW